MLKYETILNKIAPVFYKFVQYEKYIDKNIPFVYSYLYHLNFPNLSNLFFITKKIHYFYDTDNIFPHYFFGTNVSSNTFIKLDVEKISKPTRYSTYPTVFITNMIINNFSFENDKIVSYGGQKYDITCKDLFIALVGRNTYETIKKNIK